MEKQKEAQTRAEAREMLKLEVREAGGALALKRKRMDDERQQGELGEAGEYLG